MPPRRATSSEPWLPPPSNAASLRPAMKGVYRMVDGGRRRGKQLHVSTFVRENEALVCTPASRGEVYFATDKEARTFVHFAHVLLRAAGLPPVDRSIPGWVVPILHRLDKPAFKGKLRLSPATAVLARYEQNFSDAKLRALVGDLEVMDDAGFEEELGAWTRAMGGPKRIVRGRKQGADEELVAKIWRWLVDESARAGRVAAAMGA